MWQLFGQFVLAKQQMDFSYTITVENGEFEAAFATFQQKTRNIQIMLQRLWVPALTAVAIPGVVGGAKLVAACVRHLIGGT